MRRIGQAGAILIAAALACALVYALFLFGQDDAATTTLLAVFVVTLLLGAAALLVSIIGSLATGQIRLHPARALKRGVLLFAFFMAMRALIWLLFPDWERQVGSAIVYSASLAAVYALYMTSERKPA